MYTLPLCGLACLWEYEALYGAKTERLAKFLVVGQGNPGNVLEIDVFLDNFYPWQSIEGKCTSVMTNKTTSYI